MGDNYDLYLDKDIRFFGNQTQTMFPFVDSQFKSDDYGEYIDPTTFKKDDFETPNLNEMEVDVKEAAEKVVIPSKCISLDVKVRVQCQIHYIDFEGLSDGKSIKTILQHISPKKLILIHGTDESTDNLVQFVQSNDFTDELFAPKIDESINVSAATNIYQVKLTDQLVSSLIMTQIDDYDMAYVRGIINMDQDIPSLDIEPLSERWVGHNNVFIGDLRLTELKKVLSKIDIPSEFQSGSLIIGANREIRISKGSEGELMLEGPFGDLYYEVRKLVYNNHGIL
jgi:cleavage and polyadenylation specificity factor subunit 2